MEYTKNFNFSLPSSDTDDIADINQISENFKKLDDNFNEKVLENEELKEYVETKAVEYVEAAKEELQEQIDETTNNVFDTFSFNATANGGNFIKLDNISAEAHNPLIKLKSDTISDFSNVTARVSNENLIPKLYEDGTTKKNIDVAGLWGQINNKGYINITSGTATKDVSLELAKVYLPKGAYVLAGSWTNNTESAHLTIRLQGENNETLELTDTTGGTNVAKQLPIQISVGQYYAITLNVAKGSAFTSTVRIWGLKLEAGSKANAYIEGITLTERKANSKGIIDSLPALYPSMTLIADSEDVDMFVFYNEVDFLYRCGMPVLELNGDVTGMSKKDKVKLSYKYNNLSGSCDVNWQGSGSLAYPKKNYTIVFDKPFEAVKADVNNGVLSWGVKDNYCLKANYMDHSQARNVVSAKLWGQIVKSRGIPFDAHNAKLNTLVNGGAVDGFPIIIKLNGEFQGLYTFNIPKEDWLFGMDKDSTDKQAFVCADYPDSNVVKFKDTDVKLGGEDFDLEFNSKSFNENAIKLSLSNLIAQVIDADTTKLTADHTLNNLIDWESAIDYYIFAVLIGGLDMYNKNYILATYNGTKWFFSAYDMDTTLGVYWEGKSFILPDKYNFNSLANANCLFKVIKEQKTNELVARYATLRSTVMSEGNMEYMFYNFCALIPSIIYDEDVKKWPLIPSSSVSDVHQILNWYRNRVKFIDEQIATLQNEE